MKRKFTLNKRDGKLMGVCAGLADYTGIDALWIRVAAVALLLAGFGSLAVIYLVIGFAANDDHDAPRRQESISARYAPDRANAFSDVESYYSASNSRLSREIDSLR